MSCQKCREEASAGVRASSSSSSTGSDEGEDDAKGRDGVPVSHRPPDTVLDLMVELDPGIANVPHPSRNCPECLLVL